MRRADEDNFGAEAFNNRKQKGKKRGNKKGKNGGHQMTIDSFYEGQERRKFTPVDVDTEMTNQEAEETKGAAAASNNTESVWAGF